MPHFEISEETYNQLDEETRSKFNAYEPEDVEGLKTKANQLLSERKFEKEQHDALRQEFEAYKANAPKGDKAALERLESAESEIERWKGEYSTLQTQIVQEKKGKVSLEMAASLSGDPKRQALLAEKISERISLNGADVVILSKDGKETISSIDDLNREIQTEYDFLCDGNKSRGGGAAGNSGGAANAGTYTSSKYGNIGAKISGFNNLPVK